MKPYANPVFQALDPTPDGISSSSRKFMCGRSLPARLNPFEKQGIGIVALIPSPYPHMKTVPTWQMMKEDWEKGLYKGKHTIVVPSSGNTAHAVVRLAPAFGFKQVKVVMSNDTPDTKSGLLKAFGLPVNVMQVGSVTRTALEEAKRPGHYLLDQYSHMGNVRAHELFTGPAIEHVFSVGRPGVLAVAMGSGGTVAGVGRYLKGRWKDITILGVRPVLGQQVPGARDEKKMAEVVTLPWKRVVSAVVEVSRKDSFVGTRELWSAVEPQPGPTSGMAYKGLLQYLAGLKKKELERLGGKVAAFICPDDGRFYSAQVMAELDPNQGL